MGGHLLTKRDRGGPWSGGGKSRKITSGNGAGNLEKPKNTAERKLGRVGLTKGSFCGTKVNEQGKGKEKFQTREEIRKNALQERRLVRRCMAKERRGI